MKSSFMIITILASAVVLFAGASMSDVQSNQGTIDTPSSDGTDLVNNNVDEMYHQESSTSFMHRVLQQDNRQRQQQRNNNNQNPNQNRDRDRNKNRQQPRNREQNGTTSRNRNRRGDICTPFGSQCDPAQSNCCQGGCNISSRQCFCQENGGQCFNRGGEDDFCCSNRCGEDGRCSCIAEGESCAVGGAFCCGGLVCSSEGGQCVQEATTWVESTEKPTARPSPKPTVRPSSLPTLKPTPEPTEEPTPLPTSLPTPLPSSKPTPVPTFQCRGIGAACFGFNNICCSGVCGEDETCQNSCVPLGASCYGIHQFCCSGLCGEDGVCRRMTREPTREPTAPPSPLPSKAPTDPPTELPTPKPSKPPSNPPTPMPSNQPSPKPSHAPTSMPSKHPTKPPTPMPTNPPTPEPSHPPTLPPTPKPTVSPTISPTVSLETLRQQLAEKGHSVFEPRSTNGCKEGQYKLKVEIKTDKFGGDTGWSLIEDSSGDVLYSVPKKTYDNYSLEAVEICVKAGEHTFKISDDWGDGVCCQQGNGFIKVYLDEREILHMIQQFKEKSIKINVGFDPTMKMTERDFLYLEAHNRRRKTWHEGYNKAYEPLIWSNELAESSRLWAEESLVNCSIAGVEHDKKNPYGENLAENKGYRTTWGQLYPPDLIVGRWIDREVGLPYPSNAHLTAALWRGSKYVGCGEAEKDWGREGGFGKCRVQVCRYARTCNCGMAPYKKPGEDWLIPMLADTSKCGPDCPPEGCF